MVVADGRLRRAGAAVADDRPMRLDGSRIAICETSASIPLDAIRRPRDTPIWKLEGSFRCRSCGTRRYKPPVHLIKLTQEREVTPYVWVHPDDER
jgi:hypothetical protein